MLLVLPVEALDVAFQLLIQISLQSLHVELCVRPCCLVQFLKLLSHLWVLSHFLGHL